jgi:hypothetical protein
MLVADRFTGIRHPASDICSLCFTFAIQIFARSTRASISSLTNPAALQFVASRNPLKPHLLFREKEKDYVQHCCSAEETADCNHSARP